MNTARDIYFDKNYGKLYEKIEKGKLEEFKVENEYGKITNLFIKREIPINVENKKYYDIITPYGYGGVDIKGKVSKLLLDYFFYKFDEYCKINNSVIYCDKIIS